MTPSVILDDAFPGPLVYYSGEQWNTETNMDSFFNRTRTICNPDAKATYPSTLSFSFTGSDFALYGPSVGSVAFSYTLDSLPLRQATFNSPSGTQTGNDMKLWGLDGFDPANGYNSHSVKITPTSGQFAFDYILYTPNTYTSLLGRSLILDDVDTMLQYSSNWNKNSTPTGGNGTPYKGTVSSTSTKGSTVKLNFDGSGVAVYGLLNQQPGTLSASFKVDNGTPVNFNPFNGSQATNASSWRYNQQFFHQDLAPGKHSLLISVDDVSGSQMFWLDSVVFEGTSSTELTATSSSSGSSGLGGFFRISPGLIGGIIAAVVAFIVIVTVLAIQRRRRMIIRRYNAKVGTPQPTSVILVIPGSQPTTQTAPPPPPANRTIPTNIWNRAPANDTAYKPVPLAPSFPEPATPQYKNTVDHAQSRQDGRYDEDDAESLH